MDFDSPEAVATSAAEQQAQEEAAQKAAARRERGEAKGADGGMYESVEDEEVASAEKAREEKVARNKEIAASLAKLETQRKKAEEVSAKLAVDDPMVRVYKEILVSMQKEKDELLAEFDGEPKQ
ncbi:MAG: hypothetical protein Q7S04_04855 [Candidatus Moranbacteria bacterium]|nr:hypothetical protein [Candidatus Moranbacteria bacterium]